MFTTRIATTLGLVVLLSACVDNADPIEPPLITPEHVTHPTTNALNPCAFDRCGYTVLLIQDLDQNSAGGYPGMIIDAVTLTKRNGDVHHAREVVAAEASCEFNPACDPSAALGAPDSFEPQEECAHPPPHNTIVALNGGYIMLRFHDADGAIVPIERGDRIHPIRRGEMCGCFNGDRYEMSISKGPFDVFESLGEAGGACNNKPSQVGRLP